jgi:hypothetical protein
MTTPRFGRLRRFRFNLPQRIAAALLLLFLAQGLWLSSRQAMSERDYEFARCGREIWERPAILPVGSTSCGDLGDGILAYRMAGLPLSLRLWVEEGLDHFRKPENRVLLDDGQSSVAEISVWELRHRLTGLLLLIRLPFLATGCLLGGGLWWVTRRLYGNLGGYTALALYCFSPAVLRASTEPNAEILAALAVYGGIYTCIGVAHAMQGPKRKWRPRIVLLILLFTAAATAHLGALAAVLFMGLASMLWLSEQRRGQVVSVMIVACVCAQAGIFVCCGFQPAAYLALSRDSALSADLSLQPFHPFLALLPNAGLALGSVAALAYYSLCRRSRFFGNTTPLFCAILLFSLQFRNVIATPWLWALPFLLTFIGGVFADAYEEQRGRLMQAAASGIVLMQCVFCLLSLLGLL